jgi:hypothetical protein
MAAAVSHERWTEARVFSALRHVFPSPAHVRLAGVRNGTGFARKRVRTIDALVFSTYPSRGLWMGGVEIKVSRSDWKKELSEPDKAAEIQQYCHRWFVAAPVGIIPTNEVPDNWGHIEVTATSAKIVKAAPALTPIAPDILLLCAIFRAFADSHTPNAEVQNEVAKQVADSMKRQQQNENYSVRVLRESVAAFEEASGLKIGGLWEAGDIGKAAKAVLDMTQSGAGVACAIEHLLGQAKHSRDRLNKVVELLQEEVSINTEV